MSAVTEVFFDFYDNFVQDLANAPEFAVVQRQVADLIRGKIVVGRLCTHVGSMFFFFPVATLQASGTLTILISFTNQPRQA